MSFSATAAPGAVPRDSARPPTRSGVLAPPPGVAVQTAGVQRPTAARRITVEPAVWTERPPGFPTQHPYVRRFWTAAILAAAFVILGAIMEGRAGIDTLQGLTALTLKKATVASVAAALTVTAMTLLGLPV